MRSSFARSRLGLAPLWRCCSAGPVRCARRTVTGLTFTKDVTVPTTGAVDFVAFDGTNTTTRRVTVQ